MAPMSRYTLGLLARRRLLPAWAQESATLCSASDQQADGAGWSAPADQASTCSPSGRGWHSTCGGTHRRSMATTSAAAAHDPDTAQQQQSGALQIAGRGRARQGPSEDWTQHTRTQFSIRPSLLSPLYSTFQGERRKEQRRQLISNLLDAHMLLSAEVDGLDAVQVERTAQHRATSLLHLSRDLLALSSQRTNVAQCASKASMLGFYSLMEKHLGASQQAAAATTAVAPGVNALLAGGGGAQEEVDDAQLFHDVAHGKVSVWDAWRRQFVDRYASAPSLPPLDEIYVTELSSSSSTSSTSAAAAAAGGAAAAQRKSQLGRGPLLPLDLLDTNDRPGAAERAAEAAGLQREQQLVALAGGFENPAQGARMDVSGTVLAEGKRKTSVARVLVREGKGLILVNGDPYDAFFPELLHRAAMLQPLLALPRLATAFDVEASVEGGGKSAQAQAVRTALSRALLLFRSKLRPDERYVLQPMARWDRREVERMKPGQRGARASFTYVRR